MLGYENGGVKFVRMLRRRSGDEPTAFRNTWLGIDIRAIAGLPGFRRYGQHHALLRGYEKGELLFDGFEEFVFADVDSFAAAAASPGWAALHRAIGEFTDHAGNLTATVRTSVQKEGIPPADAIRSTEFVNRRSDLSLDAFRRYWIERHGPLASHITQILRYEQHHLDDREYVSGAPRFDGWAATWFTGTAAMRGAAQEPPYRDTRADEKNFLAGPLPVLFTRERLALSGD